MNQKTHLVKHMELTRAELTPGFPWVCVEKDGVEYFSSYFYEGKNVKNAERTAKKLLARKIDS